MSQVEVATTPRFAKTKARLAHRKQQTEVFLKTFEWTWTKAIVFSIALTFLILITTSVIPSFWLYFADQKLKWSGAGPNGFWLKELRDAIAMGLATTPIIVILVVAAVVQNWRRKLRGQSGDVRPTGGYR
jgi:ABC-type Fe3+ transport system permease subunit